MADQITGKQFDESPGVEDWRALGVAASHAPTFRPDPSAPAPHWYMRSASCRPQRNRIHIDIYVPRDQAQARIAAALAAGGHMVNDAHAPNWWTLADAEGDEADLAIWG